jgi:MSHA biogenesis protein MshK
MNKIGAGLLMLMMSCVLWAARPVTDPTYPLSSAMGIQSTGGRWVLSSILISPTRKIAIINGQVLQRGDKIETFRIQAIEPHRVVLRNETDQKILALLPQSVKRPLQRMSK